MTPAQIKKARLALGLNHTQAAQMLGYGNRARIYEIERGKENAGAAVVRLLKAYLDGYRPKDWPQISMLESAFDEVGVISELRIAPGDIVEFVSPAPGYEDTYKEYVGVLFRCDRSDGGVSLLDGTDGFEGDNLHKWRVISRSSPASTGERQ